MKTVFVRAERCIGCRHCEVACAVEHSASRDLFSARNEEPISRPRVHVEVVDYLTFPNRCRHCDPAPCMQVCPTDALYRDQSTGSVAIHYSRCIDCAVCAMACPFGVIRFERVRQVDLPRDVNAKCDNCIDRQQNGVIPACAEACKTGALEFGEVNDLIRKSSHDFSIKLLLSREPVREPAREPVGEVPSMPENIRAFREIMGALADL
ncbi:4Fe-4S dicluster domain-containing protein [Methanosphaerula subterraneus]|uniref:4Fe-4S dicluster domain-containing protein n=1 Tax=Methanosphaerula subterraneus TaxID=3350244 RepID=UPI003F84181E